jgi:hypothetical protein
MSAPRNLLLLALFCFLPPAHAAAPPASLTEAQQQRLRQAVAAFLRANALDKQGKVDEVISAMRRGLAIEREVHGQVRPSMLPWLRGLANLLERQGDRAGAERALAEEEAVARRACGPGHWKVIDARLALADYRRRAKWTAQQRKQHEQALRLDGRVRRLHREGKARSALAPAKQVVAIWKGLLGERHPSYATSLNDLPSSTWRWGSTRPPCPCTSRRWPSAGRCWGRSTPNTRSA